MNARSQDSNTARLAQLSEEVSRIAGTLARLSTQADEIPAEPPSRAALPEISVEQVRAVLRARRLRTRYFSEELFADPAWDMMLELFRVELAQQRVSISSLCIASAVPATTALRWIKTMTSQRLIERRADPHDGRRIFVELTQEAHDAMRQFFAAAGIGGI
jgi:DNA-binding MarR family transcriptional regulator